MNGVRFRDRRDAAGHLAAALEGLRAEAPVVLGLPRGGVPVAAIVADRLDAPLDILVVRKVGVPYQRELAMGAIGEEDAEVIDRRIVGLAGVTPAQLSRVVEEERQEVARRALRYRDGHPPIPIAGRTVVIVDDGIATGSTARAAVQIARARGARRIVLAAPVASADTVRELSADVDDVVVVAAPRNFAAVGQFYEDFSPTSDDEVTTLLTRRLAGRAEPDAAAPPDRVDRDVELEVDGVHLRGHLAVPAAAAGTVLFAHGSGSSSTSPRNRFVAERLNEAGVGTLLFDLLTAAEEHDRGNVFDIPLLTERLLGGTRWLRAEHPSLSTSLGYFGASTGAAAALRAAADPAGDVRAVVSRGGRVDLAADALGAVRAPTLMIVGGDDDVVLRLNAAAAERLRCEHELVVVPGATHLFEEPGALDVVAARAADWFVRYLGG